MRPSDVPQMFCRVLRAALLLAIMLALMPRAWAAPGVLDTNLSLRLLRNTSADGGSSIRLGVDPVSRRIHYLKDNGDIYQLTPQPGTGTSTATRVFTAADHTVFSATGMAFGPEGHLYLVGNAGVSNNTHTFAQIVRGVTNGASRIWSLLASTQPYLRSATPFDHVFNGIAASPDGQWVFVNSGSRTDHGELQSGVRELPLTAAVFRLPATGANLVLTNNRSALLSAGYLYAEGLRNAYDLAFAPNGDLFGTENGPDADYPDELNWLRPGLHYGFPWRLGDYDNLQQFPGYNPSTDPWLDPRYFAVIQGYYQNDPTFPPPPTNSFAAPVINLGPEADSFRDPADGVIKDGSNLGRPLGTFTAHRSPVGLSFDVAGALAPPFRFGAFVTAWTAGDATGTNVAGPFFDPSEDLLHLELTKLGTTNYWARVTRLAAGFSNPIDTALQDHRLYLLEWGGSQGIWEITFPAAVSAPALIPLSFSAAGLALEVRGTPTQAWLIQTSSNLADWLPWTNFLLTNPSQSLLDTNTAGPSQRFYRGLFP